MREIFDIGASSQENRFEEERKKIEENHKHQQLQELKELKEWQKEHILLVKKEAIKNAKNYKLTTAISICSLIVALAALIVSIYKY